jgi:hypothetical protein
MASVAEKRKEEADKRAGDRQIWFLRINNLQVRTTSLQKTNFVRDIGFSNEVNHLPLPPFGASVILPAYEASA